MVRQDRQLRVLLCNVHTTSRPWLLFPWLFTLCTLRRVDVVLLQELTPRHVRALDRRNGWRLLTAHGGAGVLARRRLAWDHPKVTSLGRGWYGWRTRSMHEGRRMPHVRVAGWLRVGSLHGPPGVGFDAAGRMTGVDDRRASWQSWMLALARLLERRTMPADPNAGTAELWGGDWNEGRRSVGRLSPSWLARRYGLALVGRGIDYVAVRGCQVSSWRRVGRGPGMDHDAVLYVVER